MSYPKDALNSSIFSNFRYVENVLADAGNALQAQQPDTVYYLSA